ncbi:MAG: PaaI family thioesterase [candidate division Zixibacteria bacterium]|nr:PaaI family thioesterase [candidate division Zixibacteria bacterium]
MQEIIKYNGCFVCGEDNPDGLRIRFFAEGEEAVAECTALPRHQGYPGIYHGGLVATLLDEIMAKSVLAQKRYTMTAEISVRYKKAIPTGSRLRLVGRVTRVHGRLTETEGEIQSPQGEVFATATGKYLEAGSTLGLSV